MMNKSFMRRISAFAGLALVAGLMAHTAAADSVLSVTAESVRTMTLKGNAKDIVIANPAVADITMLRPDFLTIIGKAPGRTSLLILDENQQVVLSTVVVVTEGDPGMLTVRGPRGGAMSQDSYACTGRCTIIPGSSIGGSSGRGSLAFNPLPLDRTPKKEEPITTKSQFKMKITPNGTVTGSQTSVTPQ